jgi:hypothetical protein
MMRSAWPPTTWLDCGPRPQVQPAAPSACAGGMPSARVRAGQWLGPACNVAQVENEADDPPGDDKKVPAAQSVGVARSPLLAQETRARVRKQQLAMSRPRACVDKACGLGIYARCWADPSAAVGAQLVLSWDVDTGEPGSEVWCVTHGRCIRAPASLADGSAALAVRSVPEAVRDFVLVERPGAPLMVRARHATRCAPSPLPRPRDAGAPAAGLRCGRVERVRGADGER